MSKVPGTVGFDQPEHGKGKTSTAKNPGKLGFKQPKVAAGKTSTKKNPSKVGFSQPKHGTTANSKKKNKGTVGFDQPNRAGKTAKVPKFEGKSVGSGTKIKSAKAVAPKAKGGKMKSLDDVVAYRKKKHGV